MDTNDGKLYLTSPPPYIVNPFHSPFPISILLVVKNADDILEIKEKTLNALENREKILEEYKLWREKNKQDALKNLKEVLE